MMTRNRSPSVGLGVPSSRMADSSSEEDLSSMAGSAPSSPCASPIPQPHQLLLHVNANANSNSHYSNGMHGNNIGSGMYDVRDRDEVDATPTMRMLNILPSHLDTHDLSGDDDHALDSKNRDRYTMYTPSAPLISGIPAKSSIAAAGAQRCMEPLFTLMDGYFSRWRRQSLSKRFMYLILLWLFMSMIIVTLVYSLGGWPMTKHVIGRSKLWHWATVGAEPPPGTTPLWMKALAQTKGPFQPKWQSLRAHGIPKWYDDGKLGIFIHWGLYSVPAWAPPVGEFGSIDWSQWFKNCAYAEWYYNTMTIDGSPTQHHHNTTYGARYHYTNFATEFNKQIKSWDANEMADILAQSGAKYTVLTTKHHEGFTLWPSNVKTDEWYLDEKKCKVNPIRHASRDIVTELTNAVRARGLRSGVYYSGGLDWSWYHRPIQQHEDLAAPPTERYVRYAEEHLMELIERNKPDVLWNDIGWGFGDVRPLFSYFYNSNPEGVINNRFNSPHSDFSTPEYAEESEITPFKWESTRGLGFSFGYNRIETAAHTIAGHRLVELLADVVARNGNLLINVGPMANGTIHWLQRDRLAYLGEWLRVYGPAIYGTRPWTKAQVTSKEGSKVLFTYRPLSGPAMHQSDALFIIVFPSRKGDNDKKLKLQENLDAVLAKPLPLPSTITIPAKLVRGFSFATLLVGNTPPLKPILRTLPKPKPSRDKPHSRQVNDNDDAPTLTKLNAGESIEHSTTHAPFTGIPLVMDHVDGDHFLDMDGDVCIRLPPAHKLKKWRPLRETAPIAIVFTSEQTQGI